MIDLATSRVLVTISSRYLVRSMAFDSSGQYLALATGIAPESDHL